MFCVKCGKEIDDKADVCVHCGVFTAPQKNVRNDSSSVLLALFAFFFPVVGLILYLVYESSHPLRSKSLKKGTVAGFVVHALFAALFICFYVFVFVFTMVGAIGTL